MKTILSRRILPILLCLLMVVPMLVLPLSAAKVEPSEDNPVRNLAPGGQTYHSSVWNFDRHAKYINNGLYTHSYQWWSPTSSRRPNGAGVDDTMQYCGISFNNGYYLIDEVVLYTSLYKLQENNIKYTIKALILGEWIVVGTGYSDDSERNVLGGDSDVGRLRIKLTHPLASEGQDINTNNIRIECTEYGANAIRPADSPLGPVTSHDWWKIPIIHEVELMGITGYKPEFEVPMNAYLVTNAALSGMIGADSASDSYYAGQAGDNSLQTYWKAFSRGAQNVWAEFDKEYSIDNVGINVGGCEDTDVGLILTYNIKVLLDGTIEDGTWQTVVSNQTATTVKDRVDYIIHELPAPMTVKGMMVEITHVKDPNSATRQGRAVMTELWAEISEGKKCIFLADYMTNAKKQSSASGNLACYGKAYSSSNFSYASISDPSYIIDGNVSYSDMTWIAENYVLDTYVGVVLRESHNVTKVVLYFNDALGGDPGTHVFQLEIQAKQGEEYVKVAEATSYDEKTKSYIVSVEFENPVATDDIRIVFKSDALTFPYLKELEVFEGDFYYSSYLGYVLDGAREFGGKRATNAFGDRTAARRGKYLNKISPIEYFNIALEHEVDIDWLG